MRDYLRIILYIIMLYGAVDVGILGDQEKR